LNILVADDDPAISHAYELYLKNFRHKVDSALDGQTLLKKIRGVDYDLIILDVKLPDRNGIDLIQDIKKHNNKTDIILISGHSDVIDSVNALDLGVYDFLQKPINFEQLALVLDRYVNEKAKKIPEKNLDVIKNTSKPAVYLKDLKFAFEQSLFHKKIGSIGIYSEKMQIIFNKLKKLHNFPHIPVLIEGETGTGKESIAKYIHYESAHKHEPFVAVNCATLKKELFEAELFGYEKGAFTGADPKGKDGYIQAAENGTLFLDEISEIPLDFQAKLLRVLQEREYIKVGSSQTLRVKTRIICSSNKSLKNLVKKKKFRKDLYYRLNVCMITIPPLRERKEEIIPLVILFLFKTNKELNSNVEAIENDVFEMLTQYNWPGNIRQLQNMITKLLLFTNDAILRKDHFINIIVPAEEKEPGVSNKIDLSNFDLPDEPFNINDFIKLIVKKPW